MAKRWYYSHAGDIHGPITVPELQGLVARGELLPVDLIWAEGTRRDQAVEAQSALDFSSVAVRGAVPDWLTDIARAEQPAPRPAGAPEWVAQVEPPRSPPPASIPAPPKQAVLADSVPLLPASVGACRLSLGCSTSRGKVRDRNEDHFLVQQLVWSDGEDTHEATLLVVADGMGGYQAGDRASAIVISALASALSPVLAGLCGAAGTEPDTDKLMQSLGDALQAAHQAVTQAGVRNPACKGMGSTAAVALVCDGRVVIRHIGDCRVYHQRGDVLTQVTTDQTLVNRMLERGQLTPEEAATHPSRNEVLQAIGRRAIEPSSHTLEVARGDWLIVACDGLTAHVEEATLRATARRCVPAAAALAKRLVELANEGGGTDNCTVVTAYCY